MKNILLVALLIVTIFLNFNNSVAQSYSLNPNDTVQATGMLEDQVTLTISQLNISNDTITLKWKKVSESYPSNWELSICDNQICYASLVDSGMMNPVIPGGSGIMIFHVTPHVNPGTAVIRYAVWDKNIPLLKDTITFIMIVNSDQGVSEEINKKDFIIFPNPAVNNITIISNLKQDFSLTVSDISGKEFFKTESNSGLNLETSSLTSGIYFIHIKTNNQHFTQKFIKL